MELQSEPSAKMNIDDFCDSIIEDLTSKDKINKVSNDLHLMTKRHQRVLYVYNILRDFKTTPKLETVTKSDGLSTEYRNQGNQSYKAQNMYEALQYYNLSLLYAPLDSQNYYLSISNRSAVFYSLKKFNECLKDIKYVLKFDIPDDLKERLNSRQLMASTALLKIDTPQTDINKEMEEKLKLKGERDSIYKCASTKIELKYSKDLGRHVIAKEDIKVGDVIVEEKPYVVLLLKSQFLFSCSYCLSRDLNLLPCDSCVFTMYCSMECKTNAMKEYHKVECPLMATLMKMKLTKLELLALRTAIKARTDHDDWNSLFLTIKEAESKMGTEFHGQVKVNDKWVYDSQNYVSIHTLESNMDKRSMAELFHKTVTSALFLKFLIDGTNFLKPTDTGDEEKIRECIADLLLLHSMTVPTNMHGIDINIGNSKGQYIREEMLASGAYAFHSLINHSCTPNVVRCSTLGDTTMKLVCIRPIAKGMQVLDNYGFHHALEDLKTRTQALKMQYKFVCQCEACINNWPTYFQMRPSTFIARNTENLRIKVLSPTTVHLLERGDRETALQTYDSLVRLCEELESYRPCTELCDCQESLKQCLFIYNGLIPYEYSKKVQWYVN